MIPPGLTEAEMAGIVGVSIIGCVSGEVTDVVLSTSSSESCSEPSKNFIKLLIQNILNILN